MSENLPRYAIPIFIRLNDNLEFTGTHKLRKINLRKQGYDINEIKDHIYFWDSISDRYKIFDRAKYQNLINSRLQL